MTLTETEVKKLTVVRLKEELAKRDLPNTGNKSELLERLLASIKKEEDDILNGSDSEVVDDDILNDESEDILNDDLLDAPSLSSNDSQKKETVEAPAEVPQENKEVNNVAAPEKEAEKPAAKVDSETSKLARAARFGLPVGPNANTTTPKTPTDSAKEARAIRFGGESAKKPTDVATEEAKAKRAARFGLPVETSKRPTVNADAKEKLASRAQRFGLPVNSDGKVTKGQDPKLAERAKRFAPVSEEEEAKKKARLERFGKE